MKEQLLVRAFLTFFILGVSTVASATDILWIHLNLNHSYHDVSTACSSVRPGGDLYFAAEHESGKFTRVVLSNYPYEWPFTFIYKKLELTAHEMSRIELFKDSKDRYWLKKMPLDGRVLRWILYWASERNSLCPLPQPLQTIVPATVDFEFETDDINAGIALSYSQTISVSGIRSDGQTYDAKMGFVQREYEAGP